MIVGYDGRPGARQCGGYGGPLAGGPARLCGLRPPPTAPERRHPPGAPGRLVELLAQDEDFVVRLMICENQPDAPADTLPRTVLEWHGYSTYDMVRMPRFPRKGLARYADDPTRPYDGSPCTTPTPRRS
ncbi:hypothetical protein OG272_44330 [Streptomyces sp. NBC_00104]|uniref:hypothetical protein n=1 Tax=Streptomyces sp. NBC_00104 TaxID=2903621 RepID=UPI00324C257B